ncbi:MAG TPA: VanZ family protein [Nocardioides sp.]|nr:VanZ family protein [Nocardioides sp.]
MTVRTLRPATRTALGVALALWVALLAVMLLAPSNDLADRLIDTVASAADTIGVPAALAATGRVEAGLNVVAFVPVTLIGSMLWPRPTWRDWATGGFIVSLLVEVVQAVALDDRTATHADVVANTLGALVGAVLGAVVMGSGAGRGSSEDRADLPDRLAPAQQDQLPG